MTDTRAITLVNWNMTGPCRVVRRTLQPDGTEVRVYEDITAAEWQAMRRRMLDRHHRHLARVSSP